MIDERLERAAITLFKESTNWAKTPDRDMVLHLWNMQMEAIRDSFRAKARAVMVELDRQPETPADAGNTPPEGLKYILTDLSVPVAWDGHNIIWKGEWTTAFPLDHTTIPQCPGLGLPHREHPWRRQGWIRDTSTTILLERCAYCGHTTATTLSVEDANERTWELDESDYGPYGSIEGEES